MLRLRALWQASVNATKRAVVWNSEDLIPPNERYIFNFNSKDELKIWHLYSDSEYGGLSSASLEITDGAAGGDASSIDTMSSTPLIFPACASWKVSSLVIFLSICPRDRHGESGVVIYVRSKKGCKTSYMQRTSTLKERCCCFVLCSRQGLRQDMMAKCSRKL